MCIGLQLIFFVCGRWGAFDSELADALFFELSRKNVQGSQVQLFLDRERLQGGNNFVTDFMTAMLASTVVVPLLSTKALERMVGIKGGEDSADNVLLEWTLTLELHRQKRLAAVQPLLIGDVDEANGKMSVLFASDNLKALPEVVSEIAVKTVSSFVRDNGMTPTPELGSLTVKQTIQHLTKFLGATLWDVKVAAEGGGSGERLEGGLGARYKAKVFSFAAENVFAAVSKHGANRKKSKSPSRPVLDGAVSVSPDLGRDSRAEIGEATSQLELAKTRGQMEAEVAKLKVEAQLAQEKLTAASAAKEAQMEVAAMQAELEATRKQAALQVAMAKLSAENDAKKKSKMCNIL